MKKGIACLVVLILSFCIACSRSVDDTPVFPCPASERAAELSDTPHALWGLWEVAIDTRSGDVEAVPIRDAAFHANVVQYLQPPFPNGMGITINSFDMGTGIFDLNVSITHPFTDTSLAGFDVKGILITNGTVASKYDSTLRYSNFNETRILNPDGWTRWWNQFEFPQEGLFGYTPGVLGNNSTFRSTLNPFKYFADHLREDEEFPPDPPFRNRFSPASTNTRNYVIRFQTVGGSPSIVFNYAVDACWEPQGSYAPDFPPEANQPEPYLITVEDIGSTAWYDSDTGYSGGDLNLRINVYDYGGSANPLGAMGELDRVVLESSTLFPNPVVLDEDDLTSQSEDRATFDVLIEDVDPKGLQHQEILVHAIAAEGTYNQGFGAPAPAKPLAGYAIYTQNISPAVPIPDPPTNVTGDVVRKTSGKLAGFTLNWDLMENASEYHVYWSTDPYESDGPLEFEPAPDGVVTGSTYQHDIVDSEVLGQWMLYVVARGIVDEPETDSGPSERVFIDFSGFDYYPSDPEGQNEWRRRYNRIRNRFLVGNTGVAGNLGVENSGALLLSPDYSFYRHATAYCVSPELPEIDDIDTCFFEFAHNRAVDIPEDYGYSVCSTPEIQDPAIIDQWLKHPTNPLLDYTIIYDYNIDLVDHASDYISGDEMNDMDIDGMYWRWNGGAGEGDDPTNGWSGTLSGEFELSRYSIPKMIDEDHLYVGVCFAGAESGVTQYVINPPQYPLICDEFALVVY